MMLRTTILCLALLLPSVARSQSDIAFPPSVYAARRARLMQQLSAPVVVPGAYLIRNDGRDKQDLDFWYLTGVESPYAILVMTPRSDGVHESLFLPDSFQFAGAQYPMDDLRFRRATWNRPIRRLAPGAGAEASIGIAETYPLSEFSQRLPGFIGDAPVVYFTKDKAQLYAPDGLQFPLSIRQQLERSVASILTGSRIEDAAPFVARMRLIKDEYEIAALRKAAEVSAIGLREAMDVIRPGINDLQIAGLMEYVWKQRGSPRTSFGPIVVSGAPSVSLYTLRSENYNAVDRVMQDGELLFIDYGAAEWRMYTSDVCRTYPVSGKFSGRQRRLYEIVLEAQDSAIAHVRPGVMMTAVIRAAARVFQRHGLEQYEDIERMGVEHVWGVMPSPTYWITNGGGLSDYSGARGTGVRDLGHHIGLDALDSRDYSMPLEPGMVFTVEPKLYVPDLGIAIMIEDMILVTETGYDNLSKGAPKRVDEIERIMGGR
ncbi:MAG: aminopeptidase P N-terminal domain-containing protein [Gemmatimonadales bacterium]